MYFFKNRGEVDRKINSLFSSLDFKVLMKCVQLIMASYSHILLNVKLLVNAADFYLDILTLESGSIGGKTRDIRNKL
jgi:hypothetical protein